MRIETISYLKKNASNLSLDESMIITKNGKPSYIIEPYAERKRKDKVVSLLKRLASSDSVNL